ncbi:sugar-phosphate nucleotidyltransferase, partial [Listeria monocytogenes]|nr:sugar-phosphate nucleotidyltransferase [Listeria monocytogenes]EJG6172737.1 sugar-phosphate nucleotidyltransferase [Listeria monocytogenes]
MKTIANEYETLEAIKKAMAMYELKKADKDHVATPR